MKQKLIAKIREMKNTNNYVSTFKAQIHKLIVIIFF